MAHSPLIDIQQMQENLDDSIKENIETNVTSTKSNIGDDAHLQSKFTTDSTEADDTVELGVIEGFPDWRKVECDDGVPYYFNIFTQETTWELPTN